MCYSKYRSGGLGGLEVPGFMTSFMSDSSPQHYKHSTTPNTTGAAAAAGAGAAGASPKHKASPNGSEGVTLEAIDYLAPAEQKKRQALSVLLMELTRLRRCVCVRVYVCVCVCVWAYVCL
jgi:hypothetical protein